MSQYSLCPVCGKDLSHAKICGYTYVCDCGWSHSTQPKGVKIKGVDRVVVTMVLMSALFVGSFIHAVNWDTHFFAIIPLKLKQLTGVAQTQDLKQIVEICTLRTKTSCVEQAYQQIYKLDPSQTEILAELGRLQYSVESLNAAMRSFELYFKKGGASIEAAYDYAKALSQTGQYDKALGYYKYILKSKPKTFQIKVTRSYIQTLIKNNSLRTARKAIEYYRSRSVSSSFFMDKEYKEIMKQLGHGRTVAKSS